MNENMCNIMQYMWKHHIIVIVIAVIIMNKLPK